MFLAQEWFFKFIPAPKINKYSVYSYKVAVIEPSSQRLVFRRLIDSKPKVISVTEANTYLLNEDDYLKFAEANGFRRRRAEDHCMSFERITPNSL
jgi:hypothetical protein